MTLWTPVQEFGNHLLIYDSNSGSFPAIKKAHLRARDGTSTFEIGWTNGLCQLNIVSTVLSAVCETSGTDYVLSLDIYNRHDLERLKSKMSATYAADIDTAVQMVAQAQRDRRESVWYGKKELLEAGLEAASAVLAGLSNRGYLAIRSVQRRLHERVPRDIDAGADLLSSERDVLRPLLVELLETLPKMEKPFASAEHYQEAIRHF